jgi:hypothetical protein
MIWCQYEWEGVMDELKWGELMFVGDIQVWVQFRGAFEERKFLFC